MSHHTPPDRPKVNPKVGAAPVVKKFHKNFELRLSSRKGRPHPRASEASKPEEKSPAASLVQGDDSSTILMFQNILLDYNSTIEIFSEYYKYVNML